MKNSPYLKRKGIKFISAMILFISIFVLHNILYGGSSVGLVDLKTTVFIFIYILIGLALRDYKGMSMMIERIWSLNCMTETQDAEARLSLIKSYIELNVKQWNKYCRIYNAIVNGDIKQWNTWQKIKEIIIRIPTGELSLKQFLWILGYLAFNIFQDQGYFPPITESYELLIDFGGLGFFMFTSGTVIGMQVFMQDIFRSIAPSTLRKAEESLILLETHIIYGARYFGFLRNMVDIKCELPA